VLSSTVTATLNSLLVPPLPFFFPFPFSLLHRNTLPSSTFS
jgi:hypothetical protein